MFFTITNLPFVLAFPPCLMDFYSRGFQSSSNWLTVITHSASKRLIQIYIYQVFQCFQLLGAFILKSVSFAMNVWNTSVTFLVACVYFAICLWIVYVHEIVHISLLRVTFPLPKYPKGPLKCLIPENFPRQSIHFCPFSGRDVCIAMGSITQMNEWINEWMLFF